LDAVSFLFRRPASALPRGLAAMAASAFPLFLAAASSSPALAGVLHITTRLSAKQSPRVFGMAEFDVTVSGGGAYANPFDPDEVAVDGVFRGPGGLRLEVPAFWFAPYQTQTMPDGALDMAMAPSSPPGWRLRFAPTAAGSWHLVARVRDRSGSAVSEPVVFQAAPAARGDHGFVKRAAGAGKRRYFERSDGAAYFIVGENVGWARDNRGLLDYRDWFSALGKSGANFARVWMAFRPLESKATGAGRYDLRNAALFDEILGLARSNGLACMLAFGTYGDLATGGYWGEGQWPSNPYNADNGGPVPSSAPDDFFTNAAARKLYRNRLRYLVARYSAYTSTGFWEFWNERGGAATWFAEMAKFVKRADPYRRPVTNSYGTTGPAEVWSIPEMDLTQTHRYGDDGSVADIAPDMPSDANAHSVYRKPHLMGEFGISWRGDDGKFDPNGVGTNLHNGLWSSAMAGNAGGACIWWWDSYVHPKNLYPEFTALSRFAAAVDWPRRAFEPLDLRVPAAPAGGPAGHRDLTLSPSAGWGAMSSGTIVVGDDGALRGEGALIGTLYGPDKPDLRSVETFEVTMPAAGAFRFRAGTVSDRAEVRVTVDGRPAGTFPFDARPSGPRGYKETTQHPEYGGIYQANFDVTREVPLSAGRHTVAVENVAGDWVSVLSYEFTGALSSRYTTLRPLALRDAATGETLVWLHDTESNWKNDRDGVIPRRWQGISVPLTGLRPGRYRAAWWDTRSGRIIRTETVTAKRSKPLSLKAPPFTRDVALRLAPEAAAPARKAPAGARGR
jgi:hypothetical protein